LQLPRALLFAGETVPVVITVDNKSKCVPLTRMWLFGDVFAPCNHSSFFFLSAIMIVFFFSENVTLILITFSRRVDRLSIAFTQTVTCNTAKGMLSDTTTLIEVSLETDVYVRLAYVFANVVAACCHPPILHSPTICCHILVLYRCPLLSLRLGVSCHLHHRLICS
jgi:hypothetical protein